MSAARSLFAFGRAIVSVVVLVPWALVAACGICRDESHDARLFAREGGAA